MNRLRIFLTKSKIEDLVIEDEVIHDLMKKVQINYYSEKNISKKTYDTKLIRFKERVSDIKRKLPVLRLKVEELSKFKRIV